MIYYIFYKIIEYILYILTGTLYILGIYLFSISLSDCIYNNNNNKQIKHKIKTQ